MARREALPDSIPRLGVDEDDAHNASTKVGAWPSDMVDQLRAEGFMPQSPPGDERRPSNRPTPVPSLAGDDSVPSEVTKVYAEVSAQEVLPASANIPPPVPRKPSLPSAGPTPIAFAAPPMPMSSPPPPPRLDEGIDVSAFGGRSKARMLVALVAGMIALVVFLFVMALVSQGR